MLVFVASLLVISLVLERLKRSMTRSGRPIDDGDVRNGTAGDCPETGAEAGAGAKGKMMKTEPVGGLTGPKPFLKWAGGKYRLLPVIRANLPEDWRELTYFEPFLGGGAVMLGLQPHWPNVNDRNHDLIDAFNAVRFQMDLLLGRLEELWKDLSEERYYEIRGMDREEGFRRLPTYVRAARLIYLNRTCYNGLYRENSKGRFNVPWGRRTDVKFPSESRFRAVEAYLKREEPSLSCIDFASFLANAREGSFVYLDPPYLGGFAGYQSGGFGDVEHLRLRNVFGELDSRGAKCLLSYPDNEIVRKLYEGYRMIPVSAPRSISRDGGGRKPVAELLIRNY
jgi:DNA adenine methylase